MNKVFGKMKVNVLHLCVYFQPSSDRLRLKPLLVSFLQTDDDDDDIPIGKSSVGILGVCRDEEDDEDEGDQDVGNDGN